MAENSSIAWCDNTFNPWIGCTKVEDSPACHWCYAWWMDVTKFSKTLGGGTKENPISHWGKGAPRYRTSPDAWKKPHKWNKEGYFDVSGTKWTERRARVFSLSLGDWLDEEVPIEWLADFLKVIHDTPNLDWLLLTKRPENFQTRMLMAGMSMMGYVDGQKSNKPEAFADAKDSTIESVLGWSKLESCPPNVRIGITAENQDTYNKRVIDFLKIPAQSRFISIEPMLSHINLGLDGILPGNPLQIYRRIDQIIVGGESGHHWKDRVLDLEAAADIYAQCKRWGVKFFMKQDSGPRPGMRGRIPDDLWVQEFPI